MLIAVGAITVQTPQKLVEAARGKSANLPCTYQTTAPDRAGANINWKKMPDETIALSYLGSVNFSDASYQDRVSFTGNIMTNDVTILIKELRMEDNGTYQCEVMIPKDLTGTRSARMDLVVLVAPSKPVCGIAGTAEYGQVIQLTCNSEEGSPIPAYTWKSYSPQNVERPLPQTAVIDSGGLTLKNISMDTSGFFLCTSSNKIGTEFCNITLSVMPPSMNIALYAGVIGGSLAGIIVIGIIAYCCCCRDREDKEDYEMADREEEEEEEEQEEEHQPQQKKQMKPQQYYQEDEGEEDDIEENPPRKPPMPPSNKPRLVLNNVDA
ncbi:cell surface A33 antigen isoform X2 [Hyla sarda]|uniref:cell surface A33 antigen isoform X2 n=1 Tax=Hyla sarda TaxID=327740 RepID=UPI0024C3F326|nr:cell surface A33 antigen isoform X2 [Hyla sarda]